MSDNDNKVFEVMEILTKGPYVLGLVDDGDETKEFYTPRIYAVVHQDYGVVEAKGTVFDQMWEFFDHSVRAWEAFEKENKKANLSLVEDGDDFIRH